MLACATGREVGCYSSDWLDLSTSADTGSLSEETLLWVERAIGIVLFIGLLQLLLDGVENVGIDYRLQLMKRIA